MFYQVTATSDDGTLPEIITDPTEKRGEALEAALRYATDIQQDGFNVQRLGSKAYPHYVCRNPETGETRKVVIRCYRHNPQECYSSNMIS